MKDVRDNIKRSDDKADKTTDFVRNRLIYLQDES